LISIKTINEELHYMRIGVVFPQTEFGNDPVAVRDYAQTAEGLGYTHILAYEHILGANRERYSGLQGPYSHHDPFHEPFVLYSFMAAVTKHVEFTTGILILPQRQTALVAKQAAALDVLSGGRLRLGVGVGWNWVEYEALGQNFHSRGYGRIHWLTLRVVGTIYRTLVSIHCLYSGRSPSGLVVMLMYYYGAWPS
jgi:alkanesulfonate monooxygenase SsuD/methylene tetrahydromethanopterin reductase-like flavin-dependent oxidoreductase (luciferase family)